MWYQPKKEGEWNDRKKQSNRKGNAINTVSYLTFHIQMNLPRLSVLTKAVAALSFHSRAKRRIFELNLLVGPQEYDMSSMQRLMSLKSFRLPNNKHTERIFWLWYRNIHRLVCLWHALVERRWIVREVRRRIRLVASLSYTTHCRVSVACFWPCAYKTTFLEPSVSRTAR